MALAVLPRQMSITTNGVPRVAAKLYYFQAGSATPITTHTTPTYSADHPHPVPSVSDALFPAVYINPAVNSTYKLVVKDAADLTIYTEDNVPTENSSLRPDLASTTTGSEGSSLVGFKRSETGARGRTVLEVLETEVRISDFTGFDNTGVVDQKAVLDNAIACCAANHHSTLKLDQGKYRFATAPAAIGYGIMIEGQGSQGSNEDYGTVLTIDYAGGDLIKFDGSGGAGFRGTGGGLKNMEILVANGRAANRGLYLYSTDDDHRPGEMKFDNVLMYGLGTGTFSSCIEIDGRNSNTAGGRGVRTTHWDKVRLAGARDNNKYLWIRQATHMYGNIQMDTGNGTGTLGMTVDDICDHLYLKVRAGNVILNYTGADNPSFNFDGSCDTLDINHTSIIGVFPIKVTTGITSSASLVRLSSHLVDDFTAFVSSTVGNVTGDGTAYTIINDTESYDPNACHDATTGIWTVKVAGNADIDYGTVLTSLGAAHTTGELVLDHRDSGGSSRNQISTKYNVGAMRDAANQCGIRNSIKLKVFEGDTLKVTITVSGSTKTVGVGGAATRYTFFSAKILA